MMRAERLSYPLDMSKIVSFTFGKHKGRSLAEVMAVDPEYFDYIRSRTDILAGRPELARGFAELGVSGDQTPLHNAMQTMFLDDQFCERLFRRLVKAPAEQAIRNATLRARRRRLLAPHVGRSDSYYSERTRKDVLRAKLAASDALSKLNAAAVGPDDALRERVLRVVTETKAFGHRHHPLYYSDTSVEKVQRWVAEEQGRLEGEVATLRSELVALREKITSARAEADELTPNEIDVTFKVEHRRFEERNGSDVRLTASLSATVPDRFDHRDNVYWQRDCLIEVKPYVSDDYPALLRQLETQKRLAKDFMQYSRDPQYIALVGRYGGQGATIQQIRKLFWEAGYWFLLLEDIGAEMPQIDYQPASVAQDLPLLGLLGKS